MAVIRLPWPLLHPIEIVEDIINLGEVIDARRREGMDRELGRAGRSPREVVAVDRRPSAGRNTLRPRPAAIGYYLIADIFRECCLLLLGRRSRWIELHRLVRLLLELRPDSIGVGRRVRRELD